MYTNKIYIINKTFLLNIKIRYKMFLNMSSFGSRKKVNESFSKNIWMINKYRTFQNKSIILQYNNFLFHKFI